jgi:hypothetical protein
MQATLGGLKEAVDSLKDQSKEHGKELKEIGKDVHAAKVLVKALLWIVGVVGALIGIVFGAYMREQFSKPSSPSSPPPQIITPSQRNP